MKRLLILMVLAIGCWAQPLASVIFVSVDPSGSCSNPTPLQYNILNGNLSGCKNGTWSTTVNGNGTSAYVISSLSISSSPVTVTHNLGTSTPVVSLFDHTTKVLVAVNVVVTGSNTLTIAGAVPEVVDGVVSTGIYGGTSVTVSTLPAAFAATVGTVYRWTGGSAANTCPSAGGSGGSVVVLCQTNDGVSYQAIITGDTTGSTNFDGPIVQNTFATTGTNAYGAQFNAPTGATNNYAATFMGGNFGIGTTSPTYSLTVAPSGGTAGQTMFVQDGTAATGKTKLVIKAGAGDVAGSNLTEWQNAAGTVLAFMSVGSGQSFGQGGLTISTFGTLNATQSATIQTGSSATTALVVKGHSSQTADIFQVQDSGSNVLVNVDKSGNAGIGTTSPLTKFHVVDTSTSSPRGILSSQYSTSTDGARVGFTKARGTLASPTTIVTGDILGRLMFRGYDGTNFLEMGSIEVTSTGTVATTRVPTTMVFQTATDAAPSVLTTAMTLDQSQNATFAGTVSAQGGTNILYRCTVAGTLRVGQTTTVSADCGTAVDTGLRVN